jgi:hypothetical protein
MKKAKQTNKQRKKQTNKQINKRTNKQMNKQMRKGTIEDAKPFPIDARRQTRQDKSTNDDDVDAELVASEHFLLLFSSPNKASETFI